MVRRVHPTGEAFVVQEVFGLCPVPSGAEADESLHTRKEDATEHGKMLKRIFKLKEGTRRQRGRMGSRGRKTKGHGERVQEAEGGI